jgi:phage terminase small subunit
MMIDMAPDSMSRPLTSQQEAFCLFVLTGENQSDAYRKAFNCRRMKAKTVHEKASRLMGVGKVRARVAELMQPVIAQARLTREQWLEQIARIIVFDPRKMFDAHGNPIEITELADNEAAAIAAFEFYEDCVGKGEERKAVGYTRKFRLADKLKALELYGKAQCYYAEKMELTGADGQPIETNSTIRVEFVSAVKRPAESG